MKLTYYYRTLKIFNKMAQLKCDFGTTELEDPWNAALLPNNQIAISDSGKMRIH